MPRDGVPALTRVTRFDTYDLRFPSSGDLNGSDAMNPSPVYAAGYLAVRTDDGERSGHGFVFTIGRGSEVAVAAIRAPEPYLAGRDLDAVLDDGCGYFASARQGSVR